ncbi:MAG: GGDEF domain-containing protein [Eggerthellales bacterium]|nr:GGDEF domain-containing protein [Eggerthellales bacterium]
MSAGFAENAKRALLYAGLDRAEFQSLDTMRLQENYRVLRAVALVCAVYFGILGVVNAIAPTSAAENQPAYVVCAVLSLMAVLLSSNLRKRSLSLMLPLLYAYLITLYGMAIVLSVTYPDMPAVTFIVIMLSTPLLFVDRPLSLMVLTIAACLAFCVSSVCLKPWEIASADLRNSLSFGLLALALELVISRSRIAALANTQRLEQMGRTDLLTGVRNRNSFEGDASAAGRGCAACLTCVYADLNGLHEMNNSKGHAAGDAALKLVAEALREEFGGDRTYRMGGDEFLALVPDLPIDQARDAMARLEAKLKESGLLVSLGAASMNVAAMKDEGAVGKLVQLAESRMLAQKRAYYSKGANDRRSRS